MEITVGSVNEVKKIRTEKVDDTKRYDHISELPEEILSLVLSFLTMKDAVKTRVLSRKWRYLYASTSKLWFDPFTMYGINYDPKYLLNHPDKLPPFWEGKFRFVKAVDQFMQLYRNPKITTFNVSYCLGIEFASHIDRWISFALRMQTEQILLNFSTVPQGCELYHFPCHLLPQGKGCTLKRLLINSCMLRPSPDLVNCFNSLEILVLGRISLDQSSFNNILSGCVNLLRLDLRCCILPESFSILGQSCRILNLNDCHGAERIEISSINLTTFEYVGRMANLSLVGAPSVKKVFLRLKSESQWGTNHLINVFAKDLPRLQGLSLIMAAAKQVQPLPGNTTIFKHLKILEMAICFGEHCDLLVFVASILNSSPCVQQLRLILAEGELISHTRAVKREHPKQLHYVKREYPKQVHDKLKEVKMYGFQERSNMLDLAIYLLQNAVALKQMIVSSERKWTFGSDNPENYTNSYTSMSESEKARVQDLLLKEKLDSCMQKIIVDCGVLRTPLVLTPNPNNHCWRQFWLWAIALIWSVAVEASSVKSVLPESYARIFFKNSVAPCTSLAFGI